MIDISTFDNEYRPISNEITGEDNDIFETYGEELDFVIEHANKTPNHVWTVVDSDCGMIIVAGYHLVNRVHYIITEKPWEDEDTVVQYCDENNF